MNKLSFKFSKSFLDFTFQQYFRRLFYQSRKIYHPSNGNSETLSCGFYIPKRRTMVFGSFKEDFVYEWNLGSSIMKPLSIKTMESEFGTCASVHNRMAIWSGNHNKL